MKVKIVHNSQKLFNVNVTENTSVKDLKYAISRRIGMAPEDQVLTLKGIFMEDSRPLGDYQLPKSDVVVPIDLFLRTHYKKLTPVRVSLDSNSIISIPIRLDAKVSELRSAIEKECEISMQQSAGIRLIFEHYILNDNETLDRYGIKKNSWILVVKHISTPRNDMHNNGNNLAQSDDTLSSGTLSTSPKIDEKLSPAVENIKLNVINPNGPGYVISFAKNITLQGASEQLEQKIGIPASDQRFSLREDDPLLVDMSKTLEQLGLSDGDNLYMTDVKNFANQDQGSVEDPLPTVPSLSPQPFINNDGNKMVLTFKDPEHEFIVPISLDATVQDAMDALRALIKGSPGPLWLKNTENGNYMQDYASHLSELGVKDGTVIEYVYLPAKTNWAMK